MSMTTLRFPSKIDWWLAILLAAAPLATFAALFAAIQEGVALPALPAPLVIIAVYGGLVFPMHYELDGEGLVIRHGLARRRVAYRDIRGVIPTRNPLSSPALSLDRLRIEHGRWGTMISPNDKARFLDAMARRAPHLRRDGDKLVPI